MSHLWDRLSAHCGPLRYPMQMHQMSLFFGWQLLQYWKNYLQWVMSRLGYWFPLHDTLLPFSTASGSSFSVMMSILLLLHLICASYFIDTCSMCSLTYFYRLSSLRQHHEISISSPNHLDTSTGLNICKHCQTPNTSSMCLPLCEGVSQTHATCNGGVQ